MIFNRFILEKEKTEENFSSVFSLLPTSDRNGSFIVHTLLIFDQSNHQVLSKEVFNGLKSESF